MKAMEKKYNKMIQQYIENLPSTSMRQPELTKLIASDVSISFCEAQGNATSHLSAQGLASS